MGEETVEKILKDIGLTEKEAEVYIFLAKLGALKSREVAKQIKKDKAQVLRILKSLESKGLAESTLETPKRFTAIPFEKVLDALVKAKRDEATIIEGAKKDLLLYWKTIGKTRPEAPLEKFVVIEGTNKINSRISQMITETKNQLSIVSTVPGLLRADQMGLFDMISSHPLRSKIQLRFLTELFGQNQKALKALFEKAAKASINFRGKNPDLKSDSFTLFFPSGYKSVVERNGCEAFVTFFHPSSKYSGSGTDGFFARDYVATTYPPSMQNKKSESS